MLNGIKYDLIGNKEVSYGFLYGVQAVYTVKNFLITDVTLGNVSTSIKSIMNIQTSSQRKTFHSSLHKVVTKKPLLVT